MQPLGSPALMAAYHAHLLEPHDYDLFVDVLDMEENVLASADLLDGQINILADADVRRTASLRLLDPDHSLGLDAGSVYSSALFADRMVRIRHSVNVPGFGEVVATPFVGPVVRLNRNGSTIDIECHDKTALTILGTRPLAAQKGRYAVDAIEEIMESRCGETRFRLPRGTRTRLRRHYAVGWSDEASPWAVCSRIAWAAGLRMLYSCDGYLTLTPRSTTPVFEFTEDALTSAVVGDHDFSGVINYARAEAGDKIVRTATAPPEHPLSPQNLGRNGVNRYLPSLAEVDAPPDRPTKPGTKRRKASKAQLNKYAQELEKWTDQVTTARARAQATADSLLAAGLPQTAALSFSAVPLFHLDVDDPIRLSTDEGVATLRFSEATIPLVSGDMTVGARRRGAPSRIRR
ncbi:MAG TPA: hypothetical protein VJL80_06435 [Aeromicrobium sp.]|nr:hypothetical protein [Aeromicrobium sp.]HKY57656.1 hypothetical protein [Aeromicrobium sp.]